MDLWWRLNKSFNFIILDYLSKTYPFSKLFISEKKSIVNFVLKPIMLMTHFWPNERFEYCIKHVENIWIVNNINPFEANWNAFLEPFKNRCGKRRCKLYNMWEWKSFHIQYHRYSINLSSIVIFKKVHWEVFFLNYLGKWFGHSCMKTQLKSSKNIMERYSWRLPLFYQVKVHIL